MSIFGPKHGICLLLQDVVFILSGSRAAVTETLLYKCLSAGNLNPLFLLQGKTVERLSTTWVKRKHFVCFWCNSPPQWARASSFTRFLDHTQRRTTVGMTTRMTSSSQRPLPDNTQHSQQTDIHALCGIRTHKFSRRAAEDLRLRPRGHWSLTLRRLTVLIVVVPHR